MEFELYGYEIKYSKGIENYNVLHLEMKKIEEKMSNEFTKKYYSTFANMDEVIAGIQDFTYDYVREAVEWAVRRLNGNGVHTYDGSRFLSEFGNRIYRRLNNTIARIEDEYFEIIAEQEDAAEYRRMRKECRGRWQGGGFGIEGAVKGAMTAGAANMASGLAHSTVNAIGNLASSIEANAKKNKMYSRDSYNYLDYECGVSSAYEQIVYCVGELLAKERGLPIEFPKNDVDSKSKYDSIIANIKKGYIKDEDVMINCCNILMDNPYYFDAYDMIMKEKWDPEHSIEDMCIYFGITRITSIKEENIKEQLESIDYYDKKGFLEGKEKVLEWVTRYGVDTSVYETCFEKVSALLDDNLRKVDGYEYDDVETARKKLAQIESIIRHINKVSGNDIDSINSIISELEKANFKSKEKYISYLKKQLEDEDVRYRTVAGKTYETREIANQARIDAEVIKNGFTKVKIVGSDSLDEIRVITDSVKTTDLQAICNEYILECETMLEYQKSMIGKDINFEGKTRKEFAYFFYHCQAMREKAEYLHVGIRVYKKWYRQLCEKYLEINGRSFESPTEADSEYFKMLDHARTYLQYITEKNSEKKTLFGALKTGVTGLVYKNYEPEYNYVTENGTKNIPCENSDDLAEIEMMASSEGAETELYKEKLEKSFNRIHLPYEIEEVKLNVNSLFVPTNPVNSKAVTRIMKECCSDIVIKENTKV